jgi:hypothetical protein
MVAGTPESARVATHVPKTTYHEDGTRTITYTLEALEPRSRTFNLNSQPNRPEIAPQDYEMNKIPPPTPPPKQLRKRIRSKVTTKGVRGPRRQFFGGAPQSGGT